MLVAAMVALTKKQTTKAVSQIALVSGTVARRRPEARAGPGNTRQIAGRAEIRQRQNPVGIMSASVCWRMTGDK
jgi:hypothetical protein